MRFFFYGTLLDRDVASLVLGRRLPPAAFVPAALPGHARRRVKGATYPVVVRDPRSEVRGAIVGGLSARDVRRLAAYEGPRYRIAQLKVKIGDAVTMVSVFEPVEQRFEPTNGAWELVPWQRRYKRAFLARIKPALRNMPAATEISRARISTQMEPRQTADGDRRRSCAHGSI